mgnify:CR=1 FL=1
MFNSHELSVYGVVSNPHVLDKWTIMLSTEWSHVYGNVVTSEPHNK